MATCDFWAPVTKVLAALLPVRNPQRRENGWRGAWTSCDADHGTVAGESKRNRRFPSGYRIVTTNPCLRNRRDHLGSSRMAIWPDSPAGDVALKRRSSSVAQHSRSAKPVARVLSAPIRHRRTPIPAITAVMTPRRSSSAQANSAMPPILQDLHNSVVIRSSSAMRRT